MELIQLEMFVAVYEERSFRRGAERVGRTQPAVSIAILKLEKELGTKLLERRRGRVEVLRLTKSGEMIYQYAMRMISVREEFRRALNPQSQQSPEHLRVGISTEWSAGWIGEFVPIFRQNRSHVTVELCFERTEALVHQLRDGKIDLAILETPLPPRCRNAEASYPLSPRGRSRWQAVSTAWLLPNRSRRSVVSREFERELHSFLTSRSNGADATSKVVRIRSRRGYSSLVSNKVGQAPSTTLGVHTASVPSEADSPVPARAPVATRVDRKSADYSR